MITIDENRSYNIEKLFENFLKEKEGMVSDTTVDYYQYYINRFLAFLRGRKIKTTDQLNIQVINYFVVWLNEKMT